MPPRYFSFELFPSDSQFSLISYYPKSNYAISIFFSSRVLLFSSTSKAEVFSIATRLSRFEQWTHLSRIGRKWQCPQRFIFWKNRRIKPSPKKLSSMLLISALVGPWYIDLASLLLLVMPIEDFDDKTYGSFIVWGSNFLPSTLHFSPMFVSYSPKMFAFGLSVLQLPL